MKQGAVNVLDVQQALIDGIKALRSALEATGDFYTKPHSSYEECKLKVDWFKRYVEDGDGYRLINRAGQPFSNEKEVQIFFGSVWIDSDFDANREPNNGRGPVDFKISRGSKDKSLIEFKLASNSKLKQGLEKQVKVYEAANGTRTSMKVIVTYTESQMKKATDVLKELGLENEESIVLIDARSDNKPSASNA